MNIMELNEMIRILLLIFTTLGGMSFVKFLFFMRPSRRKAEAEARLKELDVYKKKLDVSLTLIDALQQRIEQQDTKISELNERVDKLYVEKHELERVNNALVKENNELRLALKEAEHNVCVRPEDECFKGRLPKRTYCRLKKLAAGDYDAFYDVDEKEKNNNDENNGIPKKSN